jgi:hypothetical protein
VLSTRLRRAGLFLSLAGAFGAAAAPAAAEVDNGVLSIWGQGSRDSPQLDAWWQNQPGGMVEAMEAGSGFTLALEHEGVDPDVWGAAAPYGQSFPVQSSVGSGSGSAADPLVERRTMRAGSALEVVEEIRAVRGEPSFTGRWTVRNTGDQPVHFRATALANYGDLNDRYDQVSRAIAETGPLRRLGSDVPEGGLPPQYTPPQNSGGWTSGDTGGGAQGLGGLLEELPTSRWSQAELGPAKELQDRILADLPMRDRYATGYLDAAAVAQWDPYVLGTPGLAPGESATFEAGFRLINELYYQWTRPTGPDCAAGVRLVTAFGRNGPRPNTEILIEHGSPDAAPERLRTDALGEARARLPHTVDTPYPAQQWGWFIAWFDRDGDGQPWGGDLWRSSDLMDADPPLCPSLPRPAGASPAAQPPAAPAAARARPALRLLTATRHGRRVVVRGRIARTAAGRVRLTWTGRRQVHAASRALWVRPRAGRIARTILLSRRAATARRQRIRLAYAGDKAFLAASASRNVRRARR